MTSNINQLPLWCRECDEPYTALDENGVCDNCGTPNVLQRFSIPVTLSFDAYSFEEAIAEAREFFEAIGVPVNINLPEEG